MRKIFRSILFGHLLIGYALIFVSCAVPEDNEDEEEEETSQEDRNIMIDDMLSLVKQEIDDNASSLSFPDFEYNFSDKSSLLIRNAKFLGLQELSREGDADVHGTQNGDALIVNCGFLIREVGGQFSSTVKLVGLEKDVDFAFNLERIRLSAGLHYFSEEKSLNISVFRMSELRGIDISVSGLGPMNPIVEKMITITSGILENFLTRYIGETIERCTKQKVYYIGSMS